MKERERERGGKITPKSDNEHFCERFYLMQENIIELISSFKGKFNTCLITTKRYLIIVFVNFSLSIISFYCQDAPMKFATQITLF